MKYTKEKNRIIIDFEDESSGTERIIKMLKEREELYRCAAERQRAGGWIGSAAIDEVRADEIHKILMRIDQILK